MKKPPIEFAQPCLVELRRPAGPTQQDWELPSPVALVGSEAASWERLRDKSVALVGCGSVGGTIADEFARAGIGRLILIDPKRYRPASLATHCVSRAEVGEFKALTVGTRCKDANRHARVFVFAGTLEQLELGAMAGVDLVAIAPDNLPAEIEASQRCSWLGIPLIQASVHGPTLTAQVRFLRNADTADPCLACAYGRTEREMLDRQTRFSCEGAAGKGAAGLTAPATNSLRALCAMAGSLAVIHGIRFLLQSGKPLTDAIVDYCGFTHRTFTSPLQRSARCLLEHTRFEQVEAGGQLAGLSLAQLTRQVTGAPALAGTRFQVGAAQWVEMGGCDCAQPQTVRRFVSPASRGRNCERCGSAITPLSFYSYERPSASVLGSAMDEPLVRLGASKVRSVLIRTSERSVLVRPSTKKL